MTNSKQTNDYRTLFLSNTPLMDVRAPVEYVNGAFPGSTNIPLLDDHQRELVGSKYKIEGQDAAIALGWQLATPEIQTQRLAQWKTHIQQHPTGYLYCFRGGLRSQLSQQLLHQAGVDYPLVTGGYKAMRRFLLDELEASARHARFILISGRSCSGKTIALQQMHSAIDLEALANHRGSAFGGQVQPQPSQIDFENALSIALMKQCQQAGPIFIEDESKLVGCLVVPTTLLASMRQAPVVVIETDMAQRVEIGIQAYVIDSLVAYQQASGEEAGWQQFNTDILLNLDRIQKRLGGDRHTKVRQGLLQQLKDYEKNHDQRVFSETIQTLLQDYYDPMYDYQLANREAEPLFKGSIESVIEWGSQKRQGSMN